MKTGFRTLKKYLYKQEKKCFIQVNGEGQASFRNQHVNTEK